MPCIKCPNGKWKYGERGRCQFDTKEKCEKAQAAIKARENKVLREYRQLFLQFQPTSIRTAEFDHREHIVVPVIALTEGVMHAVNSEYPEMVLAEEFSAAPDGWNGRPVVGDHPILNGQRVSANIPEVLETEAFGLIFHTKVKDKQLHMEAWLDPRRAEAVGEEALKVIERVQALEAVEVSVGAFVSTDDTKGEFEGKHFQGIWREIVPDHLAMLPRGTVGACSVEMGCGAPRAARMYTLSGSSYTLADDNDCGCKPNNKEPKGMKPNELWQQYKDKLKELSGKAQVMFRMGQEEDDMSDSDIREALNSQLQSEEPGFLGVEAVFMNADPQNVVFAADPEGPLQFFRRSFSLGENNVVTLGSDDKEEVRHVVRFEPVVAQANDEPKNNQGESKMDETKKARIQKLIDSDKNPFVAADLEHMGTFDEDRLASLEAQAQESDPPADPPADPPVEEPAPADPPPVEEPQSEAEAEAAFLAAAPKSIQMMVARAKQQEATERAALVSTLKGAQTAYTEAELNEMEVCTLKKLADVAGLNKPVPAVDFSGLGTPRVASDADAEEIPAAPSIFEAFKKSS